MVGRPRLIAQLEIEYTDGRNETIATDETWQTAPGPILRNNIYLGEVYDARLEEVGWDRANFDDEDWGAVSLPTTKLGPLQSQPLEPIRVTGTLRPIAITEPDPGVFIVDLGQNFAGGASEVEVSPRGEGCVAEVDFDGQDFVL